MRKSGLRRFVIILRMRVWGTYRRFLTPRTRTNRAVASLKRGA